MTGTPYVALQGLEAAPLEDGAVLYHPHSKKFIMLNRSAAMIWNELATPMTRDQLVQRICATYPEVDKAVAGNDVSAALKELEALELISTAS